MPQVNYTIDNTNPLIQYQPVGAWIEGSKTLDSSAFEYSNNGTFTTSIVAQSSASFTFNGSAVWIFGAKRINHGPYSVNIDNTISQYDGFANPGLFQVPLFSAPLLKQGLHTVTITNTRTSANAPFLDIDFITWTSELGNATNIISEKVVQDTDPAFSYQPSANWNTTSDLAGFNGTAHATFVANSSMTYTFTGDSITLFGAIGPNSSPYSVQLDGGHASNFNATKLEYTPQVPLYHADNLGGGNHSLHIVNYPDILGQALAIDYVVLSNAGGNNLSALSQGGDSGSTSGGNSSSVSSLSGSSGDKPDNRSQPNTAVIGGLIAGLLILLGVLGALLYLWRRRRNWRKTLQEQGVVLDDKLPPESFMYSPYPMETRDSTPRQSGTDYPPPVHFGSTPTLSYSQPQPLHAVNGFEGKDPPAPRPDSKNGLAVPLPPTAGQSLAHIPASELFSQRMVVQGRAQDFGPLPPDYFQATQSYKPEY